MNCSQLFSHRHGWKAQKNKLARRPVTKTSCATTLASLFTLFNSAQKYLGPEHVGKDCSGPSQPTTCTTTGTMENRGISPRLPLRATAVSAQCDQKVKVHDNNTTKNTCTRSQSVWCRHGGEGYTSRAFACRVLIHPPIACHNVKRFPRPPDPECSGTMIAGAPLPCKKVETVKLSMSSTSAHRGRAPEAGTTAAVALLWLTPPGIRDTLSRSSGFARGRSDSASASRLAPPGTARSFEAF